MSYLFACHNELGNADQNAFAIIVLDPKALFSLRFDDMMGYSQI